MSGSCSEMLSVRRCQVLVYTHGRDSWGQGCCPLHKLDLQFSMTNVPFLSESFVQVLQLLLLRSVHSFQFSPGAYGTNFSRMVDCYHIFNAVGSMPSRNAYSCMPMLGSLAPGYDSQSQAS